MNPKERVRAILERRPVDRIPVDIWCTPEVLQILADYTGCRDERDIYSALGVDKIFWIPAPYQGELRPCEKSEEEASLWGWRCKNVRVGPAEYSETIDYPLKEYQTPQSLDDYPWWPDPDCFDYDAMGRGVERAGGFATLGPWVSLFEIYCTMRGLEQAMMDTVLYPKFLNAALDRIEAIQTDLLRRFLSGTEALPEMVFISDDMGTQNGLLFSLESWQAFLGPRLKRWCELIHSYGVKVFYHSDGAVAPLIPHLLTAGVDVLNPIQHVCPGMEMSALKEQYGDRLIFHGGIDNQTVLPFGIPEQVEEETKRCLEALGRGGGYVCCSCHNIQVGTPLENILSLVETVHREGAIKAG